MKRQFVSFALTLTISLAACSSSTPLTTGGSGGGPGNGGAGGATITIETGGHAGAGAGAAGNGGTAGGPAGAGGAAGGIAGAGGAAGGIAGAGGAAGGIAGAGGAAGGLAGYGGGTGGLGGGAGPRCSACGYCSPGYICDTHSAICYSCSNWTPPAPDLTRPTNGAYTGSLHAPSAMKTLRPTFSWWSVGYSCNPTYELQVDDSCTPGALQSCTFPSPEVDVQGLTNTSYTPTDDLKVATTAPVGTGYAWRVRACYSGTTCGAWSYVRYLQVGRVREDIDGDGYGDLLALSNRGLEVYQGGAPFSSSDSSHTLPYTGAATPISFVGDVNGDGFGDFFGTSAHGPSGEIVPTLFLGGKDVTALQTVALTNMAAGPSTTMQTNSAGDLNGDGLPDLIVQWADSGTTPQNELRIFYGGPTLAGTPDLSIPGPYAAAGTLHHSGRVGDMNGDGLDDIALTASTDTAGVIQIFAGGTQPSLTAMGTINTPAGTYQIEPAGDITGDGYDDAVVVLAGSGYSLVTGDWTPWNQNPLPLSAFVYSGTAPSAAGMVGGFDIDGDSVPDFAIGDLTPGAPLLYRWSNNGPTVVSGGLANLTASTILGYSDHDGDGRPDLIGTSGPMSGATIEWAGGDGTTNPAVVQLHLSSAAALFTGLIAR
jgi:hypothetical protein